MSLITKRGGEIKDEVIKNKRFENGNETERAKELTRAFIRQLDTLHAKPEVYDREIEKEILEEQLRHVVSPRQMNFTRGLPTFSPSSASKCELELYYKVTKAEKDEQPFYPFQRRWNRNGSAIHGATQRDLLYSEKYVENAKFKLARMKADGSPAWEHNLKNVKPFAELGFQLFGMMDGVLQYTPDELKLGFEFKTKSTTISAIGDYKLKRPSDSHVEQCVAYALLFGVDEFLIVYESLAKDSWNKGEEAKPDLKAFYLKVSQAEKDALLEKFTRIAKHVKNRIPPTPDLEKCIFCPYKALCDKERTSLVS